MRIFLLLIAFLPMFFGPASAQQQPLRIGFQTAEVNVLLTYAVNTGLFEKEKLDVKLIPFPAGPAMLPALAANEIDMGWMGEFPSVTGYSNGLPIEILMMERLDYTNIRRLFESLPFVTGH
jgi:taurine transport system substrate-binding protein